MRGFTLVEVIIVIGLFSLLVSLVTINLLRPQATAQGQAAAMTLVSDMKSQQINAMVGEKGGVHFEDDRYILFTGPNYVASDTNNFSVVLAAGMRFTTINWPNKELVFAKRSGEVVNFTNGQNSVVLQNQSTGEQKTITVNRLGAITLSQP